MDRYRIASGAKVNLHFRPTDDAGAAGIEKSAGREETKVLNERLEELQELLYAEGKHRVLIVLQAMDAGGKDGTIRHVFDGVNPQGVTVASFKRPTHAELAHDYLWRVHPHVPANGMISIFNRSHYEDVLVVRVHDLVPEPRWRRRYEHIRAFEQTLVDEGTTVLKFMLHISPEEQAERFQSRLDEPHKRWKFSMGDLGERERWAEYMAAFEEAISETSTDSAPWYVIPADRKWYRNLVISRIIVRTLEGLEMKHPPADLEDAESVSIPDVTWG